MWRVAPILSFLVLCTTLAAADVYKCPDGKGGSRFQNAPCVGNDTEPMVITSPSPQEGRPAASQSSPVPSVSSAPAPAPAPSLAPSAPSSAPAEDEPSLPVDSRQFGLITDGMSEAEIIRRLGKPDKVVQDAKAFRWVLMDGRRELREVRRVFYYYPGRGRMMDTIIIFEDGAVVAKEKRS